MEAARLFVDTFEIVQKERIRAQNRLFAMKELGDEQDPQREKFMSVLKRLEEVEQSLVKEISLVLKEITVYNEFLKYIRGVGPLLSARLLALPLKLGVPLSSWNAYFGLTPYYWKGKCKEGHKVLLPKERGTCPVCGAEIEALEFINQAPRRVGGYKSFWNRRARKLAYLLGEQFVRIGSRGFYGRVYRSAKERYSNASAPAPAIVIDARARRHAVKLFISHFYEASHELAGLSAPAPYAFEYLRHDQRDRIGWKEVVTIEKAWKEQC